ncbi:GPI biosynthesis protein family Pig-F-domain-containing protein [Hysterangium stoloniferum]|nr:GPI biosynthesis protein family Pig-F-domain-containing protein [Hysterangium stoloniferum]
MSVQSSTASPLPVNRNTKEFPYFQYISRLGTLTLAVLFTAIYLPASSTLIAELPPQQSSLDKPQHRLLVPITANPLWTLGWLCSGVFLCQVWWGGWMREWWSLSLDEDSRAESGKLIDFRNACSNTAFMSIFFHCVIVMFGAPIFTYIGHTYLMALHSSIITVFVPSYALSLPTMKLTFYQLDVDPKWSTALRLFGEKKLTRELERSMVYPVLASFIGSWIGAFAIALDWDRPWQAWPLTPAYGAMTGYIMGSWGSLFVNLTLFFAAQDGERQVALDSINHIQIKGSTKKASRKKVE